MKRGLVFVGLFLAGCGESGLLDPVRGAAEVRRAPVLGARLPRFGLAGTPMALRLELEKALCEEVLAQKVVLWGRPGRERLLTVELWLGDPLDRDCLPAVQRVGHTVPLGALPAGRYTVRFPGAGETELELEVRAGIDGRGAGFRDRYRSP